MTSYRLGLVVSGDEPIRPDTGSPVVDASTDDPTDSIAIVRMMAIVVANGLSSEVVVMSRLIRNAPGVEALVFVQRNSDTAERVAEMSDADTRSIDFGWRKVEDDKILSRIRRIGRLVYRSSLAIPHIVRAARTTPPDVIYSSQQKWDCLIATFVARIVHRPHVVHLHYIPGPWLGRQANRRLRTCDLVIGVSRFIQERAVEAGTQTDRATYVLNPIPVADLVSTTPPDRRSLGVKEDVVAIGFVARIVSGKGHADAAKAFALLDPTVRGTSMFYIVGDGPDRPTVEALCRELGIADRMTFFGVRTDVSQLLQTFDFFVHPSYEDPCPLAVLEAQAAGLPVVAFDEGGISEIVENGKSGLLAPERSVEGLASAMAALISDPARRASMGAEARRRMSTKFAPSQSGAAFAEALSKALHSTRRS